MEMESININTCRTCLAITEPNELKSMFRDGEFLGERIKLADVLQQLVAITIDENDSMPSQMCNKCILILFRSYMFHKKCISSNETLKKLLNIEKLSVQTPQFCITETDDNTLYFCDQPNINEKILDTTKLCEESLLKFDTNTPIIAHTITTTNLKKLNPINYAKEMVISNYQPIQLNNDKIRYAIYYENPEIKLQENVKSVENISNILKTKNNLASNELLTENYINDLIVKNDNVENIILEGNCEYLYRNLNQQQEKAFDENIQYKNVDYIDVQDVIDIKEEETENEQILVQQNENNNIAFEDNLIIEDKLNDLIENDTEYLEYEKLFEMKINSVDSKNKILKQFICHICNKILATSNSYKYHMQLHSDVKPYSCNECGEAFKTRNAYVGHLVTHDKNNPHKCDDCGKIYRQASSLKNHLESFHNGKKPFMCSVCGKGFTQNSGYKKHLLVHTGEKPHVCSTCGKSFRYSSNLMAHKRGHIPIKENRYDHKHICMLCAPNRIFPTTSLLKKHMLSVHDMI